MIADHFKIPQSADDERERMTMEIVDERGCESRKHENSKWAICGINEFYWTTGGFKTDVQSRCKTVGITRSALVPADKAKEQNKMICDGLDNDLDKNVIGQLSTPRSSVQNKRKVKSKARKEQEKEAVQKACI